ncbi:hypothetical protein SEA_VANLEE_50 [Gordonia phage VanLee]|uniref:Uncharacterized protein n=1 Tax=Gordonia phage VanLee TaxID=2845816 RepID=A0A8F2D9F4_9CAUD|nr:hypothetical protein QEH49_gp050 [Gordonia phage VanLee]QWS68167.1 hypothetical protein SEA_VANLEE_50 [Gordonia phage VanLee]
MSVAHPDTPPQSLDPVTRFLLRLRDSPIDDWLHQNGSSLDDNHDRD